MSAEDPEDRARSARQQPSGEQCGRCAVLHLRAARGKLMHYAKSQAVARQVAVDRVDTDRQNAVSTRLRGPALQRRDLRSQGGKLLFCTSSSPVRPPKD